MRTKRGALRIATAVVLLLAASTPSASARSTGAQAVDAQGVGTSWIVTLKPGIDVGLLSVRLAKQAGGRADRIFQHALHGFVFKGSAEAAAALRRNRDVRTVVPDGPVGITAEVLPVGIARIDADHPTRPDAHDSGFTGSGARIAILDTGVDLTHPDLVPNLDIGLGRNCITAGPPQDGHGHGTHVAGIAAAVAGNGIGVIGVAPSARIVPIKVLDDTGNGEWSNLICAIDYLTGLSQDADPTNDVQVANMSLGDTGGVGSCTDGFVREAICRSVAAGITYVAAAGNSTVDASTFIPAAFPEVITVSAMTDLDGSKGGLGGCVAYVFYCDDTLAEFSNYGAVVDVTAPGYNIYSSWTGGGYQYESGTSMAAPHVAGVVALVKAARPSLSPSDVESLLKTSGECPNGEWADAGATSDCAGQSQWPNDPDGRAEPLINALRAAQGAATFSAAPTIHITGPAQGASVGGIVPITATATDDHGVVSVSFLLNGKPLAVDTDPSDGWGVPWNTAAVAAGAYTLTATAADGDGKHGSDTVDVLAGTQVQGNWVGTYGHDGYALFAWTATSDLVLLPGATLTTERGIRSSGGVINETRVLQTPDAASRRAGATYDGTQVRLRLNFVGAYTGSLHLYALDFAGTDRRQRFTVDDGSGAQVVNLSTVFHDGAWLHFPISVAAGGVVSIVVDKVAGENVLINGLFLGDGPPALPTAPSAPGTPAATANPGSVSLTWTPPVSDGGSPVTGYRILRGTAPGNATQIAMIGNLLTYTDLTATPGPTWLYSIGAINAAGAGPTSVERRATLPDVPGVQGNWVGTYGHDGYALFAWTATSDLVLLPGATLTTERGIRSSGGVINETRVLQTPDAASRRAGATYDGTQVRLRLNFVGAYTGSLHLYALDFAGTDRRQRFTVDDGSGAQVVNLSTVFHDGAWLHFPISVAAGGVVSIVVDKVAGENVLINGLFLGDGPPATTIPDAPSLTSATPSSGQVQLSWNPPLFNGGSPIVSYTANASPGGATCSSPGPTTCTITGLTNGVTYSFAVTATNAVGTGPASNTLTATPSALPSPPQSFSAAAGNAAVSLSWAAPITNGGSAIVGYRLYRGTSPGTGVPLIDVGNVLAYVDTGLANGTTYYYRLTALNGNGEGASSGEISAKPAAPITAPGAPTLNAATPGNALVALGWSAPATNGGSPITSYVATATPGNAACTTSGATSCSITGLANGTAYTFTVRATNAAGTGAPSNTLTATPRTVPTAPRSLAVTPADGAVSLAWLVPTSNGGTQITGYVVTATPGGATCSTNGALNCIIGGLTNGLTYSFSARAVNAAGTGPASNVVSTTPRTTPGGVQNLAAETAKAKGVLVTWIAPVSDGGAPITAYKVYRRVDGGAFQLIWTLGVRFDYTDTGTVKGTRYYYIVRAVNAAGEGPPTTEVSAFAK